MCIRDRTKRVEQSGLYRDRARRGGPSTARLTSSVPTTTRHPRRRAPAVVQVPCISAGQLYPLLFRRVLPLPGARQRPDGPHRRPLGTQRCRGPPQARLRGVRPLQKSRTHLITAGHEPTRERLQPPEKRDRYDDTSKCILCAACTGSCPVYWVDGRYVGPATIVNAHRFIFDSRDTAAGERLEILKGRDGVFRCRTTFNCTDACPRGIQVTQGNHRGPAGHRQRADLDEDEECWNSVDLRRQTGRRRGQHPPRSTRPGPTPSRPVTRPAVGGAAPTTRSPATRSRPPGDPYRRAPQLEP